MSGVLIRRFLESDLETVARLWWRSWASTGLAADSDPLVEDYRAGLGTECRRNWHILVASSGAQIVGFVALDRKARWLREIFVEPAVQRTGVGIVLLEAVKRQMPDGFWLRTHFGNAAAQSFYEGRGLRHNEPLYMAVNALGDSAWIADGPRKQIAHSTRRRMRAGAR